MNHTDKVLLSTLYRTYAPSGSETRMRNIITTHLESMYQPYSISSEGVVYRLEPGKPLVCAHMDQIGIRPCVRVEFETEGEPIVRGFDAVGKQTNLGADDKNGIFIALKLIQSFGKDINFIFSVEEEIGGVCREFLQGFSEERTNSIPYGLIFDRRGGGDVIGTSNAYCEGDLEDAVLDIAEKFGYRRSTGTFSDCDHISEFIPCVNLSCGYYNAHTAGEYTVLPELENAVNLGYALIKGLGTRFFKRPELMPASWWWKDECYG